jgi:hypothetical protein
MKTRLPLIAITLMAATSLAIGQSQQGAPFSLTLQAVQSTVQLGSPILVELTTTNNLSQPLKLGKSNPGSEYQIDVRDERGQVVAQTELYKQLQNPEYVFRMTNQILKPRESAKEQFNIGKFFDFTKPGTYSIQVQRLVPRQYGSGAVKSNTVVITIT